MTMHLPESQSLVNEARVMEALRRLGALSTTELMAEFGLQNAATPFWERLHCVLDGAVKSGKAYERRDHRYVVTVGYTLALCAEMLAPVIVEVAARYGEEADDGE